jgi:hypothetical protein
MTALYMWSDGWRDPACILITWVGKIDRFLVFRQSLHDHISYRILLHVGSPNGGLGVKYIDFFFL